jgi:hypothetical protein
MLSGGVVEISTWAVSIAHVWWRLSGHLQSVYPKHCLSYAWVLCLFASRSTLECHLRTDPYSKWCAWLTITGFLSFRRSSGYGLRQPCKPSGFQGFRIPCVASQKNSIYGTWQSLLGRIFTCFSSLAIPEPCGISGNPRPYLAPFLITLSCFCSNTYEEGKNREATSALLRLGCDYRLLAMYCATTSGLNAEVLDRPIR